MLEGRDTTTIEVPESVSHITEAQTSIGWEQLLKGRLAKEWMEYQKQHLGDRATRKNNANTWATDIITSIFRQWLELWKLRNGDRHGRDYKTQAEAAKKQAVRELEQLYEYKGNVMPQHDWIFESSLEQQQAKWTYILSISNFGPVIEASYKTRLNIG